MAGGCEGVFRRRRRMPHGVPFSADAAHVYGDRARGSFSDQRHHAADAADPRYLPMGSIPAQSRRAHAGNGDRQRARLSVADVCRRSPSAPQPRHPPAPGTFAPGRPAPRRIDEQPSTVIAGNAGHLLWRRDRHGGQHPSWRSQCRTHTDAMVAGSQRRIFPQPTRPRWYCRRSWIRSTAMGRSTWKRKVATPIHSSIGRDACSRSAADIRRSAAER